MYSVHNANVFLKGDFMNTNVKTKFGWSKLIAVSMVFAVVAMLSVLGFFFTNANADDTANPSNDEPTINIPVNDLCFGQYNMMYGETGWSSVKPTDPPQIDKDIKTYNTTISDPKVKWSDKDGESDIYCNGPMVHVEIAAQNPEGNKVYNSWSFFVKYSDCDWYLVENGDLIKVSETPRSLNPQNTYSIYFGKPDAFSIRSADKNVKTISGHYQYFYSELGQSFENVSLPTLFDLTGQITDGTAYYDLVPEDGLPLHLEFKDIFGRTSTYTIYSDVAYDDNYWTLNGKEVSTDPYDQTKLDLYSGQYINNKFVIEKKVKPEPITNFKVKGQIVDESGNPVPNATVGFYNYDLDSELDEPMVSALTDEYGNFVLEGCSTGTGEYFDSGLLITIMAKHYSMGSELIDYYKIGDGEYEFEDAIEIVPAMVDLYSDSPQHKSFNITVVEQQKGSEPVTVLSRNFEYFGTDFGSASANADDEIVFNISDNGVLTCVHTDKDYTETITVTPNSQDGYIFDNYLVNDKTSYRVGDSIDLAQTLKDDHIAQINTNYVADTSTDTPSIAKTSDQNIYGVVALIAVVATTGTLLVLRRRKLSF